jgi:hypothetical protein
MDSGFRRNDGFWTFDESIKYFVPGASGLVKMYDFLQRIHVTSSSVFLPA